MVEAQIESSMANRGRTSRSSRASREPRRASNRTGDWIRISRIHNGALPLTSLFFVLWIVVGSIQLGLPIGYFALMKRLTAKRDYHLSLQSDTQPTVTVIVPTYNEASVIEQKLSNITQGTYPISRLELIVVDSASLDATPDIARRFLELNR